MSKQYLWLGILKEIDEYRVWKQVPKKLCGEKVSLRNVAEITDSHVGKSDLKWIIFLYTNLRNKGSIRKQRRIFYNLDKKTDSRGKLKH